MTTIRPRAVVGKRLLVGISAVDADGRPVDRFELRGLIVSADPAKGITLRLAGTRDGETYTIPPPLEALIPAKPGEYRLGTTGEVVVDPDFTAVWTVERSPG